MCLNFDHLANIKIKSNLNKSLKNFRNKKMYIGILLKHFLPIEKKFKLLLFRKCKNQI